MPTVPVQYVGTALLAMHYAPHERHRAAMEVLLYCLRPRLTPPSKTWCQPDHESDAVMCEYKEQPCTR